MSEVASFDDRVLYKPDEDGGADGKGFQVTREAEYSAVGTFEGENFDMTTINLPVIDKLT